MKNNVLQRNPFLSDRYLPLTANPAAAKRARTQLSCYKVQMNILIRMLLVLPIISVTAFAGEVLHYPEDVRTFIETRDGCDHFRGEYPYNEERRKFLEENINKLCIGTDKKLSNLKIKYAGSSDILERLSDYEAQIELAK